MRRAIQSFVLPYLALHSQMRRAHKTTFDLKHHCNLLGKVYHLAIKIMTGSPLLYVLSLSTFFGGSTSAWTTPQPLRLSQLIMAVSQTSNHDKAIDENSKHIVVVGGGIGGLATALDAAHLLRPQDKVTVVSDRPHFSFTPSNPWVAIGWRKPSDIQLDLQYTLPRHGIAFHHARVDHVHPEQHRVDLSDGTHLRYDFLIAATGPKLATDTVPGLGQHGLSICTTPHAVKTLEALERLCQDPGPCVIGATQGASCFGPAYEYAFLLETELRKRGGQQLVEQCPITFVTSEPYIGHLGLNGAGNSQEILERLLMEKNIVSMINMKILSVDHDSVKVQHIGNTGNAHSTPIRLPSKLTMLIPPFHGHDVWKQVPGLTDKNGMLLLNEYQQSNKYPDIYGVGIVVHLDPVPGSPVHIGAPKTGYMIESMGTAAICNIRHRIRGEEPTTRPLLNGLCITDFGDTGGAIFVTMPQMPPRRHDWTIEGQIAKLAKIAFEKYFLYKIEWGDTDPYYEKYMLQLIGVKRTEEDRVK
jgi:NADH dehydrogenase FAD-containing subunit